MIIIATRELINKDTTFKHDIVADINNLSQFQKTLLKNADQEHPIKIYDLGTAKNNTNQTIEIKDHLNKTGVNPIINNPQINKITFQDISEIYNTKEGIITTCCGKNLNPNYANPSHFLCVFSILGFYLGFKNIKGYIVQHDKV